jgi:hypothetical protein
VQPETVADELAGELGERLAGKVAATVRDAELLSGRDTAAIERLRREIGDPDPVLIPELDDDVHDVDGLALVHAHLAGSIDGSA